MTSKVSIIILVYNTEKYLSKCLDSVIGQSYKNLEIICVDDGSTDSSAQILENYAQKEERIRVITQKNVGPTAARNVGLEHATGEYVSFVDSDDYITPEAIETLVKLLTQDDSDLAMGAVQCFGQDESVVTQKQKFFDRYNKPGKFPIDTDIRKEIYSPVWNKIYKMSIIKEFNLKFPEGLINGGEYWLWAYGIHCKAYSMTDKILYFYRQRPDSIMATRNDKDKILNIIDTHCLIYEEIKKYIDIKQYEDILTFYFIVHMSDLWKRLPKALYDQYLTKILKYYNDYNHSDKVNDFCQFVKNHDPNKLVITYKFW